MHRLFQRDLCKLRLSTARSFVKVITDGQGPLSTSGSTPLRLDAKVAGLGPFFKLRLTVKNTGVKPAADIPLTFVYNHDIFAIKSQVVRIPLLIPGLSYVFEIDVQNIDPNGAADPIRVFVCNAKSAVPIISAIGQSVRTRAHAYVALALTCRALLPPCAIVFAVNMPQSELLDKE
jgi:Bardet-Biedl syndrome 1 protein